LKAFRVDLKAWLYLTNAASSSSGKIEAGFWIILLCGPRLLLGCPYYEPLLGFMIHSSKEFISPYSTANISANIKPIITLSGIAVCSNKMWTTALLRVSENNCTHISAAQSLCLL